jgi:hypothetical protein
MTPISYIESGHAMKTFESEAEEVIRWMEKNFEEARALPHTPGCLDGPAPQLIAEAHMEALKRINELHKKYGHE